MEFILKFLTNTPAGGFWLQSMLLTGLTVEKEFYQAIYKSVILALSVASGSIAAEICAIRFERHSPRSPTFWQTMVSNVYTVD